MDREEYKRKALEPIVNYIESVFASYSKEELEARIKEALPKKESEDEKIMNDIMVAVENSRLPYERIEEIRFYLNNHKEQKPESCDCSRDEESYTNGIHHVLMNPEAYGLIKQQPAEWSEEDKRFLTAVIGDVEYSRSKHKDFDQMYYEKELNWLKGLPNRFELSHWKPSEE